MVSATSRPLYSPVKTRYPLYRKLGGPQGRSGQVRKILPPPRFDPRTVQPAASRYIPAEVSVKPGGTYSNHRALNGYLFTNRPGIIRAAC